MAKAGDKSIIPDTLIRQKIYFARGVRVILDADLAKLHAVTTSSLIVNLFPKISCFSSARKKRKI